VKKVAIIGIGAIGTPIARCLMRAGFVTTVYDVRREAIETLVAMGANGAESVGECARGDAVIVIVANDAQVEDVVAGPRGILNNLTADTRPVIVVMSTVSPETVRRLGKECRARDVEILDAPVSGGHVAAEKGKLSVMVGGTKEIFEGMKPVLSAIGERLYYMGELGTGEVMKLTNNIIGVTNMFLTIEALATGVRNGVPLDTLLSIIDTSSGSNFHIRNWPTSKAFFSDLVRTVESARNNLSLSIKDLTHAQELVELSAQASPLLAHIIKGLEEMDPEYLVEQWTAAVS
jgi:3-hydroxyisobutyrate dehydrogenase-like beta-hydroxyacid dehydrogenase